MDPGDRGGAGELEAAFLAHRVTLLHHAQNFLGPRSADAQDFVQDTMERFVAAFPGGPPPEPRCTGWLMTTLTHLLISEWRKQSVRRRSMADPTLPLATSQPVVALDSVRPPTAVEKALENITSEDFSRAVGSLSRKLRPVYELHTAGRSHAEIADSLGISVLAARKRLHDARLHLRKQLQLDLAGGTR